MRKFSTRFHKFFLVVICFFIAVNNTQIFAVENTEVTPDFLLAKVYEPNKTNIKISDYLVSEKFDGVRAFWDGKNLWSRGGENISAPSWFLQDFPNNIKLDGELWLGRNSGDFEKISALTRQKNDTNNSKKINENSWKNVKFLIFECPSCDGDFLARYNTLLKLKQNGKIKSTYIEIIPQIKLNSQSELLAKFDEVKKIGGEGLMLHKANSLYHSGRSSDLLKFKIWRESIAEVIGYKDGKGKYNGKVGSLKVRWKNPDTNTILEFNIGSGLSDLQRENPPKVGEFIEFKFREFTKTGKPRFPIFVKQVEN